MDSPNEKERLTISELALEFEISPSSIRFYEEKGLITPERSKGNQRIYSKKHRARLKMILRGKRFGFSLDEISEMIGHEKSDIQETEQIDRSLCFLEKKIEDIHQRKIELDLMERDIRALQDKLAIRKKKLESRVQSGKIKIE